MLTLLQKTLSITLTYLLPSFKYLVLLAIFVILLYKWSSIATNVNSSPPSPRKLPIIGNLHQLSSHPHRSLETLAQRHGPLMLLHFGSAPVLVVSSAEGAREIMKTHDITFANRPKTTFCEKVLYNYKDVAFSPYGEYWRQLRSICVLNLLSTKRVRSFRSVREEETNSMINNIKEQSKSSAIESVLNLKEMFVTLSNDVLCRVALGKKYSDRGEGGRMFKELTMDLTAVMARVNIGDYIPWLAWLTRLNGLDAQLDNLAKRMDEFLDIVVQEHVADVHIKKEDQKDLVDVLLSIQRENVAASPIDRVSLKAIILDLFVGGTESTSTALEWTMSELLRHPEVMKKLQNEVRGIASNKTDLREDDLAEMHYLKAVIKETLRLHPPAPLLLPRISSQDVKINGYNIKANTQVIVNSWPIGRDPKSYDKPEEYKPERFLNSGIDYKGNDFQFISFGAGRRGCPGIQFSVTLQEIALANLVHKFAWVLPGGARGEELDMTESTGVTVHRESS